jgi:hypothetical protein
MLKSACAAWSGRYETPRPILGRCPPLDVVLALRLADDRDVIIGIFVDYHLQQRGGHKLHIDGSHLHDTAPPTRLHPGPLHPRHLPPPPHPRLIPVLHLPGPPFPPQVKLSSRTCSDRAIWPS